MTRCWLGNSQWQALFLSFPGDIIQPLETSRRIYFIEKSVLAYDLCHTFKAIEPS